MASPARCQKNMSKLARFMARRVQNSRRHQQGYQAIWIWERHDDESTGWHGVWQLSRAVCRCPQCHQIHHQRPQHHKQVAHCPEPAATNTNGARRVSTATDVCRAQQTIPVAAAAEQWRQRRPWQVKQPAQPQQWRLEPHRMGCHPRRCTLLGDCVTKIRTFVRTNFYGTPRDRTLVIFRSFSLVGQTENRRKYERSTAPQIQPTLRFSMTAHSLIIWEWAISGGGPESMRGSR